MRELTLFFTSNLLKLCRISEQKRRYAASEKGRAKAKEWLNANPEKRRVIANRWASGEIGQIRQKENYERNAESIKKRVRAYAHANPDKKYDADKRYRERHQESIASRKKTWQTAQQANNPTFRLVRALRQRIRAAVKGKIKTAATLKLLGCSVECLWQYLERGFKPGMTRVNYGEVWHIDHIRPCASFDLSQVEQQKECFHWSNLQPLFVVENLRKGSKFRTDFLI